MRRNILIIIIFTLLLGTLTYTGIRFFTVKNIPLDKLVNNISNNKDDVFKDLKLVEEKNIYKSSDYAGEVYKYNSRQKLYGYNFSLLYLLFNNGKMYGFTYENQYNNQADTAYSLAKNIYMDFNKRYGEPTTFSGLSNKISDILSDKSSIKNADYYEQWKVNNSVTVYLHIEYIPDNKNRLSVQYKIDPLLLKENK